MNEPTYSIVIPVYNEAATLPTLFDHVRELLDRLDGSAEVILVDDGSADSSFEMMRGLNMADERFKAVRLSRNFGHQTAITAGMDLATGEAVVVMDADLQDPPGVVLEMASRWREGYEVVYGVRVDRTSDTWFKRTSARAFYRVLRRFTEVDMPVDVGDFRLIDRRALDAVMAMREGSRFVRGMVASVGFRQIGVPYRREARHAGETKYPLRKMIRLAADGIVAFSRIPLRLALPIGLTLTTSALLAALVAVVMDAFRFSSTPWWAVAVWSVWLLGGVQLAVLGLIGEYLGRTYEESLSRPIYIVSDLAGLKAPASTRHRTVIAPPRTALIDLTEDRTPPSSGRVALSHLGTREDSPT